MTKRYRLFAAVIMAAGLGLRAEGVSLDTEPGLPPTLVLESGAALARGEAFLLGRQQDDGSWLHSPAITGLGCMALYRLGAWDRNTPRRDALTRARQFVIKHAREDGAICSPDGSYINYSTAICLTALAIMAHPDDVPVMKRAREFLMELQLDQDHPDHPTSPSDPFYGGIGYGSGGPARPDLSNTQLALEALYVSDYLSREPFADAEEGARADLAWQKAVAFLEAVQNLQKTEGSGWLVTDEHDGGFVYRPDQSKASEKLGDDQALRSYGSMTYAGLKSMIYAELSRDDPRVQAAADWARRHYTLDENPGMGPEGHFYYLQMFAKAHAALGDSVVVTPDNQRRRWRVDLAEKLLALQKGDGHWVNDASGRWQESIPDLVTCYALVSLKIALGDQLHDRP